MVISCGKVETKPREIYFLDQCVRIFFSSSVTKLLHFVHSAVTTLFQSSCIMLDSKIKPASHTDEKYYLPRNISRLWWAVRYRFVTCLFPAVVWDQNLSGRRADLCHSQWTLGMQVSMCTGKFGRLTGLLTKGRSGHASWLLCPAPFLGRFSLTAQMQLQYPPHAGMLRAANGSYSHLTMLYKGTKLLNIWL